MEIILASQSPRRKQILSTLGLKFKVIPSEFDESIIKYNNIPSEYCETLAFRKAEYIANKQHNKLVIGADTIVICDNEILQKPKNVQMASTFLKKLSGKSHQVFTGISFILNHKQHTFHESTTVKFKKLSNYEINHYIYNFNPMDKAGGYGIQDWSSIFVKSINGCYFNVVGFPISRVYSELQLFNSKIIENLLVVKIENM
ncbi:MAG: septum formation protein Maf [Candidatus Marinimicrobia bacterium]|nr:septum formation protein Maf [Candidatus Neomarinimicrobiota bacterium]